MKAPLMIAAMGNLIDMCSTLLLIHEGYTEANPFMAALLSCPFLFVLVKIGAMSWVLWRLEKNRGYLSARITAWFAAGLYGLISVYYLLIFWSLRGVVMNTLHLFWIVPLSMAVGAFLMALIAADK